MFHSPQVGIPSSTTYAFLLGKLCLGDAWLHNKPSWCPADICIDGPQGNITLEAGILMALKARAHHGLALAAQ